MRAFSLCGFVCLLPLLFCVPSFAQDPIRFWLVFNEPPTKDVDSGPKAFDSFASKWLSRGIDLRNLRHKVEQRPGYFSELLGQRSLLEELAGFRDKNPGYPVIEPNFFAWPDYGEEVRAQSAALRPDLMQVPSTWCNSLAGQFKLLAPVADKVDERLNARYETRLLEPCLVNGRGPLFGLPWLVDVRLFYFWRSDFPGLQEALSSSNNARETFWDALRSAKAKGVINPFAIPTAREWELMHHLALLVWGQGGQLVETRRRPAPVFQEPALRGATFIRNLLREGLISLPERTRLDLEGSFLRHEVSGIVGGPWLMRQIHAVHANEKWDQLVGIALPPFYESREAAVTFLGGSELAITGRLEANRAPALALARYLSESPETLEWTGPEGLVPAANSLRGDVQHPASRDATGDCVTYYQCLAGISSDLEAIRTVDRAIKVGRGYPAIPQWWDFEVPGSLGPIYKFWQHLSTLDPEDSLKADLAELSTEWTAILDPPGRLSWLITVPILWLMTVAIVLIVGGWYLLNIRRRGRAQTLGAKLGEALRAARIKAGHSYQDVTDRTNIDIKTIREIERGKRATPQAQTVKKISRYIEEVEKS